MPRKIFFIIAFFLLTACSSSASNTPAPTSIALAPATPTSFATPTVIVSATVAPPTATSTLTPSITPTPAATSTLTPTQTVLPSQGQFPGKNFWSRIIPTIVWCNDPASKVTLEVHIVGRNDVARVQVISSSDNTAISLYDDGTHGDQTGTDGIFMAADVVLSCNSYALKNSAPYAGAVQIWIGYLRVTLKDGTVLGNNQGVIGGQVDPRLKNIFAVKDFGNGLSATAYTFFIQDSRHTVLDNYPLATNSRAYPAGSVGAPFRASRLLYTVMPDNFDFVALMPAETIFDPSGVPAYSSAASNAIKYIGKTLYNESVKNGSAGQLKRGIYHFCCTLQDMTHELVHAWGANVGRSLGLLAADGVHWNLLTDINGQLSVAPTFQDNGDGTWQQTSNGLFQPYAPLELYLMGLIPPDKVPPIHILTNPNTNNPQRVTAASVRTVTIDDIIKAEGGAREPGVATAQKDFTLAFMVTQDRPYNDAAYAYFSVLGYWLMTRDAPPAKFQGPPFYWATGGRATLNTRLPVDVPDVPASVFRP